jgi:hypothetical protein
VLATDLSPTPGRLSRQQRIDGQIMAGVVARGSAPPRRGRRGDLGTGLDDPGNMRAEVH